LRLGCWSVDELLATMPLNDFLDWWEWDKHQPIGDERGDIQAALVAATVLNAHGGKVSVADCLEIIQYGEPKEEIIQTPDQMWKALTLGNQ